MKTTPKNLSFEERVSIAKKKAEKLVPLFKGETMEMASDTICA